MDVVRVGRVGKLVADTRGVDLVDNIVAKKEAAELRSLIREKLQMYSA